MIYTLNKNRVQTYWKRFLPNEVVQFIGTLYFNLVGPISLQSKYFFTTSSIPIIILFLITNTPITAHSEWKHIENIPICTSNNEQYFPTLTTDGNDGVIVTWRDGRNGNYDIYAQRVDSNGEIVWIQNGIPVCNHDAAQGAPEIVSDMNGGAIIVWGDTRNGSQDSFAQRINANGDKLWHQDGVSVCVESNLQDDFTAISDGNGAVIVVWEDWRAGNQDIYAQKLSADGKIVWEDNGIAVFQGKGDQYDPSIISDGEGGAYIAWWDISTPDWNIIAQRIDSKGSIVWDTPIPICTAEGNQGAPTFVSDGAGGAFCVWADYRNDPNIFTTAQLYAQHINATGKTLWRKDGIPICELSVNQQQHSCLSDGEGGFLVVWWDDRDIFADIYAQRVSVEGNILWDKKGIPLCTEGGVQQNPMVVSDGDGGAIAYWLDYREDFGNTTEDAIYAQRVDANGKILWNENGVPVCDAEKEQITPQAISVGAGSAIVVWSDARGKDHDIYIHRIQ